MIEAAITTDLTTDQITDLTTDLTTDQFRGPRTLVATHNLRRHHLVHHLSHHHIRIHNLTRTVNHRASLRHPQKLLAITPIGRDTVRPLTVRPQREV